VRVRLYRKKTAEDRQPELCRERGPENKYTDHSPEAAVTLINLVGASLGLLYRSLQYGLRIPRADVTSL